jgi:hypothetical protein
MSWYVTAPERKDMRRMRESGMNIRDIHALFPRRSFSTIHRHVRDISVEPGRPRSHRKCDPLAALRLRAEPFRLTYQEIGERFGVTKVAVFTACQRYLERQEARA